MAIIPSKCSVLIVGAGPSGLLMAAQLLRNGVHPIIIDSRTQPSQESKAIAIQARSLEIFRQLGLDEKALAYGNLAETIAFHDQSGEVSVIHLSQNSDKYTQYPGVLLLEQSKTERLLIDYLTANTCPIYWNTSLINLQQSDKGVIAGLSQNSQQQSISCKWLVGADGASSAVRKLLNITFGGGTYKNHRWRHL